MTIFLRFLVTEYNKFFSNSNIENNKKKASRLQSLIGKCHILNGQEELGLGILKKNHMNLESAFGIVSEETALSLKLIGSVELTLGKRVVNPGITSRAEPG